MSSRLSRFLLACLLTIIASGDDVNLMRVVFPAAFTSPIGSLPLDDPNMDFVARAPSRPHTQRGDAPVFTGTTLNLARVAGAGGCPPSLPARAGDYHIPCPSIMPPLRC
jgi:hypothetical protein